MKKKLLSILVTAIVTACTYPVASADNAERVYRNGRIYTVDEGQPWTEAVAIKECIANYPEDREWFIAAGWSTPAMSDETLTRLFLDKPALTLEELIEAYTINVAWSLHYDEVTGSIEAGKFADMIVLNHNLFEIPVTDIHKTEVHKTVFKGEVVYEYKNQGS